MFRLCIGGGRCGAAGPHPPPAAAAAAGNGVCRTATPTPAAAAALAGVAAWRLRPGGTSGRHQTPSGGCGTCWRRTQTSRATLGALSAVADRVWRCCAGSGVPPLVACTVSQVPRTTHLASRVLLWAHCSDAAARCSPVRPDAAVLVAARADEYVSTASVRALQVRRQGAQSTGSRRQGHCLHHPCRHHTRRPDCSLPPHRKHTPHTRRTGRAASCASYLAGM